MLPAVLEALEFRCNNTAYRPLMDALELLRRYTHRERVIYYDPADRVPLDGVVRPDWRSAVVDERGRVERIPYELCVLTSTRDAIRRRDASPSVVERRLSGVPRGVRPRDTGSTALLPNTVTRSVL